jgi:hypothetical protein
MGFSDFFTHSGKRICREHYNHLVQASRIDGKISEEEMAMLHRNGRKFGLTDPEINSIIESESKYDYNPPYSLIGKFIHLYNLAQIVLADDVITEHEKKLLKRFAIEAGFNDNVIEKLFEVLVDGIRRDEDEDKLFEEFKRKHFFRE